MSPPEAQPDPGRQSTRVTHRLVNRVQQGEAGRFAELYDRVAPALYAWACHKIPASRRGRIEVDDVLQEVWCRAHRRFATFTEDGGRSFRGWLFGIGKHVLLDAIRRRVEEATGRRFNSVLANLYRDGRDSVGWHRDSDYAHGGQPDLASVSFGATRRFEVRDEKAGRARAAVDLESGSVLLISGEAIERWWHRVPKTSRPVGPRVNLTFRHMVTGP